MRKMSERATATAWPDNELDFQFIFLLIIGQARRRSEEETEKGKRSFGGFARSPSSARRRTADVTRRARASGGDRAAADNHFGGDVSDGGGEGGSSVLIKLINSSIPNEEEEEGRGSGRRAGRQSWQLLKTSRQSESNVLHSKTRASASDDRLHDRPRHRPPLDRGNDGREDADRPLQPFWAHTRSGWRPVTGKHTLITGIQYVLGEDMKRNPEMGETAIQPVPAQTADLSISGLHFISSR